MITSRIAWLVPAMVHSNFFPINFRCIGFGQTWLQRVRRVRARPRRRSLRNGYYIQGRQQARKLPNPDTGTVVTINTDTGALFGSCNWNEYNLKSLHEEQLGGQVWCQQPRLTTAKAFAQDVFINQERKLGGDRRRSDTVVVLTIKLCRLGIGRCYFLTRSAPYEKSKCLGSRGEYGRKAET
ncbi:hypothetical protein Lal_00008642 [Lupinus albus]|nr:hypothetical protein Lal_00008642 [Lupinus albus]